MFGHIELTIWRLSQVPNDLIIFQVRSIRLEQVRIFFLPKLFDDFVGELPGLTLYPANEFKSHLAKSNGGLFSVESYSGR